MRKIIFAGQVNNKYSSINFTKKKKRDITNGVANLAATGYLGQQTIRSGIPRLLGVRLESHSTSKKNAKEILKNGGWLDPNKGGTGASKAVNAKDYIKNSKNYVHLTGRHADDNYAKRDTLKDLIHRKRQRALYRGVTGEDIDTKDLGKVARNVIKGLTGKGKTLYLGGSDEYFNKNFIPDPDDVALKTSNKIRVQGNRASATLEALKREGVSKLVKANPKRALAGAAILTVGSGLTAISAKDTYNSFNPNSKVKGFSRKNKSGKWSNVKSFIRDKIKK